MEQVTPDVNLPGLKQKGKEAEAIGKGGAKGDGAADQVHPPMSPPLAQPVYSIKICQNPLNNTCNTTEFSPVDAQSRADLTE